jgi:hypothetical protein
MYTIEFGHVYGNRNGTKWKSKQENSRNYEQLKKNKALGKVKG